MKSTTIDINDADRGSLFAFRLL